MDIMCGTLKSVKYRVLREEKQVSTHTVNFVKEESWRVVWKKVLMGEYKWVGIWVFGFCLFGLFWFGFCFCLLGFGSAEGIG